MKGPEKGKGKNKKKKKKKGKGRASANLCQQEEGANKISSI